jgi:hypothetical protein
VRCGAIYEKYIGFGIALVQIIGARLHDGGSDSVGRAIRGSDKRGDNLVRLNHQRRDQKPPDGAENGADFARNGAVW